MVEGNVFIYYGIVISKGEAFDICEENGKNNINEVCEDNGIKCQYVGNNNYSSDLIIGREIFWNYGHNFMKLDFEGKTTISTQDVGDEENKESFPLSKQEEAKVKELLLKIGISGKLDYYVISAYDMM